LVLATIERRECVEDPSIRQRNSADRGCDTPRVYRSQPLTADGIRLTNRQRIHVPMLLPDAYGVDVAVEWRQASVAMVRDDGAMREVTLRDEKNGLDSRHLWAYLDNDGNLHIEGQDLGPATAIVSNDGEYEWHEMISARDVPRLLTILGADPTASILDDLEMHWSGSNAGKLDARIRASGIDMQLSVRGA
jgi:hypothetical protein